MYYTTSKFKNYAKAIIVISIAFTIISCSSFIATNLSTAKEVIVTSKDTIVIKDTIYLQAEIKSVKSIKNESLSYDKMSYFKATVRTLKSHESFVSKIYKCPAGYPTIGYGHRLRSGDKKKYKNGITKLQADELFIADVNRHFAEVVKLFPELSYNKQLALCAASFNLKVKSIKKIYADIKANPNNTRRWASMYKYKHPKTGDMVASDGLLARRKFEIALYQDSLNLKKLLSKI